MLEEVSICYWQSYELVLNIHERLDRQTHIFDSAVSVLAKIEIDSMHASRFLVL